MTLFGKRPDCMDCGCDITQTRGNRCSTCAEANKKKKNKENYERIKAARAAHKAKREAELATERAQYAEWEARRPAFEDAVRARREREEQERLAEKARKQAVADAKRNQPRRNFVDGFRQRDLLLIGPRIAEVIGVSESGVWVASNVETSCYAPDHLAEIARPLTPTNLRAVGLLPPHTAGIRGFTYQEVNAINAGVSSVEILLEANKRPAFHASFAAAIERECAVRDMQCGRVAATLKP